MLLSGTLAWLGVSWTWLFLPISMVLFSIRMNREELFLIGRFPDYAAYIVRTWRIFPGLY